MCVEESAAGGASRLAPPVCQAAPQPQTALGPLRPVSFRQPGGRQVAKFVSGIGGGGAVGSRCY